MNKVLMLSVVSLLPVVGTAQVVTPVPPAAPAAPAWTPPPPPAPVTPPKPAVDPEQDKDIPTPDIVKRSPAGEIVWPDKPAPLVVFEAIPLDEGQRKTWGEKWAARAAQQDELIVQNAAVALQVRDAVADLDKLAELGDLIAINEPKAKIVVAPSLEQYIRSSQVMRPKQLNAYDQALKHFKGEMTKQVSDKAGQDKNKLMVVASRSAIREVTAEAVAALDRMAAAMADNWTRVKAEQGLSGDFSAGEKMLADAKDAKAKAAAGIALLRAIPAEKQAAVLGMFKTPAPAVKTPADPGVQGVDVPKTLPKK